MLADTNLHGRVSRIPDVTKTNKATMPQRLPAGFVLDPSFTERAWESLKTDVALAIANEVRLSGALPRGATLTFKIEGFTAMPRTSDEDSRELVLELAHRSLGASLVRRMGQLTTDAFRRVLPEALREVRELGQAAAKGGDKEVAPLLATLYWWKSAKA